MNKDKNEKKKGVIEKMGDTPWEEDLRERIRTDEAAYSSTDSLWDHLLRVAKIAERLGREEGLDPALCRMAGLFHDAGKFTGGHYHEGDRPEEEDSVVLLKELAQSHKIPNREVELVAEAIIQLYRDDSTPSPLGKVLYDADNLDKLGRLGVANFFIKAGLRGRGVSPAQLYKLTVELTHVHHISDYLWTESGRALAKERAAQSKRFHIHLLDELREDGLYDFKIEEVEFEGVHLQVVSTGVCECSRKLDRRIWSEKGLKCKEIHLEHSCSLCGVISRLRFCRPRGLGE